MRLAFTEFAGMNDSYESVLKDGRKQNETGVDR